MDNQWIFGIDGGGTSTRLRIESLEGKMLYQAESLSMNPRSVGWNGSRKTLDDLFQECTRVSISPPTTAFQVLLV